MRTGETVPNHFIHCNETRHAKTACSQQPMVTKMAGMVVVLPVAKEEGTPAVRPDGSRWVWSALPVFPRHCLPLNLLLLLLLLFLHAVLSIIPWQCWFLNPWGVYAKCHPSVALVPSSWHYVLCPMYQLWWLLVLLWLLRFVNVDGGNVQPSNILHELEFMWSQCKEKDLERIMGRQKLSYGALHCMGFLFFEGESTCGNPPRICSLYTVKSIYTTVACSMLWPSSNLHLHSSVSETSIIQLKVIPNGMA